MRRPPTSRSAPQEPVLTPRAAAAGDRATVDWEPEGGIYGFRLEGVEYRLVLGPQDERSGLLRIEGRLGEGEWHPLLQNTGVLFRETEGAVLPPTAASQRLELEEVRHELRGGEVRLQYREWADDRPLEREVTVKAAGRSLDIEVSAPAGPGGGYYCGVHLGAVGPEDAPHFLVPGVPDPLVRVGEGFAAAYVDRSRGSAASYPGAGAFYRPDTEGSQRPIREWIYLTLSEDPLDPLPALRRATAPYRIALESRVTLDFYSDAPFNEDARLLRLFQLYGLDDVLLIYRNWQQFGYGRRGPLLYPANPDRGSNQDFRDLVQTCMEDGWLVALREEYGTVAEDSPYWSEKAVARWPDGEPRLSRRPGQHGIIAERMLDYARLEATKIQRNYRPSAVFVDGHTAWSPETCFRQVDSAPNSASGTEADAVRHFRNLAAFLREIHEGPVVGAAGDGPARFDTFAEGLVEGVLRGPDGGATAPLIVDYELQEVRPRLLGIGCGSYRQFCSYPTDEPVDASRVDWDAYRATEIALGHTGYVGNYRIKPGPRGIPFPGGSAATACREYYLLRALQELYVSAPITSVLYAGEDGLVPLAEALRSGLDLTQARVRVEYGSGLTVWVNRAGRGIWPVTHEGENWELPPSGFLAVAPRRLLAYSALVGGQRTDFCRGGGYTFLDVRGTNARFVEEIRTDGGVALLQSAVPGRQDVVLIGASQLDLGSDEYRLSERADVRFTHLSPRELEITVLDSDSGKPVHVQFPGFGGASRADKLRVSEHTDEGWVTGRTALTQTRGGPQLARARCGVTYRVSLA